MTSTTQNQASSPSQSTARQTPAHSAKDYEDIRQECREKLRAYSENEAYVFLRDRAYGTDQYAFGFFQRWLDGLLAKRINYAGNRQNELMLLAMQARNEELYGKPAR
ncbi:hypothetical protein PHLH6_35040 [Pseudomonas sp. Seg1]|uniref:hypothetical protein n=1 Tax=unclassified Pseudomonas TaxID=196821 RepID=UPI001BB3C12C|nr:hypothetical protein [Pseudomonas sp. Seg1]BBP71500.1 hypothetical protein PHLH6_35040 [Pseudomonas sp. Seg1]